MITVIPKGEITKRVFRGNGHLTRDNMVAEQTQRKEVWKKISKLVILKIIHLEKSDPVSHICVFSIQLRQKRNFVDILIIL